MASPAGSSLFAKIHDTISKGLDEQGGTPAAPAVVEPPAPASAAPVADPAPAPAPAPAVPATGAVAVDNGDDEDFEFDEDKQPAGSDASPAAPPQGAAPATPATSAQPTPVAAEGAENEDAVDWGKMLPQEVEQAFLRTSRGKAMLQGFKERRELAKPATEGGLGFLPTVQQIKDFHQAAANMEAMEYDFRSGSRDGVSGWVNYWFEPSQDPRQQHGQRVMAQALPYLLKQTNPDAYRAIGDSFGKQMVEELLSAAKSSQTDEDRKYFARFARSVHEYIFGEEGVPDVSELTGDPKPPAPSPEVQRLQQQLSERDQRDQEARRKSAETRQRNAAQQIETSRTSRLSGLIDNALSLVKERLGQTVYYKPTVDAFMSEVHTSVQSSPGWSRYQMLRSEAIRSGKPEAVNAANEQYFQLAKPVIRTLRAKYLRDANAILTSQNSAQHQARQTAVTSAGTPGGGAPSESPVTPSGKPERLPGESQRDWMERIIRSGVA